MSKCKTAIVIAITILVAVLACGYLYQIETAYDDALGLSFSAYCITIPLCSLLSLWHVLVEENPQKKQTMAQKIGTAVLLLVGFALIACLLVLTKGYSLSAYVMLVLMVSLLLAMRFGKNVEQYPPILAWAGAVLAVYVGLCATTFGYVQVVQPITVEQATQSINVQYENYEFVAHLTGNRDKQPLGVYWFVLVDDNTRDWLELDVLSGQISCV